jgi:hypothetical protein
MLRNLKRRPSPTQGCRAVDDDDDYVFIKNFLCLYSEILMFFLNYINRSVKDFNCYSDKLATFVYEYDRSQDQGRNKILRKFTQQKYGDE